MKCYQYFQEKEKCPWCPNEAVFAGKHVRREWFSPQTEKTYELIDTPLKNPDGSISKLEILRDITAQKQEEKQLKLSLNDKESVLKEMQQRINIAAEIQSSLLPKESPPQTGLEISALNIMARNVGGDYYDNVLNPSGQLAFVIADVMGKDISAALFMTMVRAIWRNNVMASKSPDDILSAMNHSVYSDFNASGRFVSMFSALYDSSTFTLTYSNGGHNPPLYLPDDSNQFEPLDTDGMLIGILPDSKYSVAQRVLNEGDLIVVYTDGTVEAERDEALFGMERLQDVIIQNRSGDVKEIQNKIISAVKEYTQGEPQSDDLTLMVLRVAGI